MIGTIINSAAILAGIILGSFKQIPLQLQQHIKAILGAYTFFIGIKCMIKTFDPGFAIGIKLILVAILSLILGNLVGKLLRLQKFSNLAGGIARIQMQQQISGNKINFWDGFNSCVFIFCLNPIGIVGAVADGVSSNFYILIAKSVMDGFAAISFYKIFKLATAFSTIAVFVWQGTITLVAKYLVSTPFFNNTTVGSIDALCGLFCFIFVLPILDIKKVRLANYLPSIVIAPLIAKYFI